NGDGKLLSGMYAEVRINLPAARRVFELPATVLMTDASGVRIATVDAQNHVHLQRIVLERDLGQTVQIASGIDGSERVVQVPGPELADGQAVEAIDAKTPPPNASSSAAITGALGAAPRPPAATTR
ncbi:MAG TPA: hypothetical protein VHM25_18745, partial [Polyangiaceae bacterium]|nr:hypothetical protein [Polyangiaceae bacterium]